MSKRTQNISKAFIVVGLGAALVTGCKREYHSYAECVADNPDAATCGEQTFTGSTSGVPHSAYVPMYHSSSGTGLTSSYSESVEAVEHGGFGESAHGFSGGE